jgi:hypothetical protein
MDSQLKAEVAVTWREFRERGARRGGKTYVWVIDDNGRRTLKPCVIIKGGAK